MHACLQQCCPSCGLPLGCCSRCRACCSRRALPLRPVCPCLAVQTSEKEMLRKELAGSTTADVSGASEEVRSTGVTCNSAPRAARADQSRLKPGADQGADQSSPTSVQRNCTLPHELQMP